MNNPLSPLSALLLAFSTICAAEVLPFPSNAIVTVAVPDGATSEERAQILDDFEKCLLPSRPFLRIVHDETHSDPSAYIAGLWVPREDYTGVSFERFAIRTNDVFTVEVRDTFLADFREHLSQIAPYTNEISQITPFLQSLSPTNIAVMTGADMLDSFFLTKNSRPGNHAASESMMASVASAMRSHHYSSPPLMSFCLLPFGPSGQDTYLWCILPQVNSYGTVASQPAIYYNGRWWLSNWFWEKGEQQW